MQNTHHMNSKKTIRTIIFLILGAVYLALVAATFIFQIDLAADKTMQYILHITVILSAFAFLLFVDMIYTQEKNKDSARLALIFAALFTIPVLIGRGLGLAAISLGELNIASDILNFYAGVSVSRTVEMVAWTTFFPLSMLFLAKTFHGQQEKLSRALSVLCLLSAICCFIAFMSIISSNIIYLLIGVLGWGIIALLIVIFYLLKQLKHRQL